MTHRTRRKETSKDEDLEPRSLAVPAFGLPRLFEDFMKPFDELASPLFPRSPGSIWTALGKEPSFDVQDRGDHFILTAELPGFDKKDVEVKISSNAVELRGEKTGTETGGKDGAEIESSSSYLQRYMTLPEEVISEKASGTMKNGILELRLPKREPKALGGTRRVDLK